MELITFIAGVLVATSITYGFTKKKPKQQVDKTPIATSNIHLPTGLGLHTHTGAERIERNLAQAMDGAYFQAVKERIIRKQLLTEKEYALYLLELKRYFFLTTIMKSVPMYNEKVDVIWHEMLLFTKSYDAFCTQFMGSKIHHEPTLNPTPNTEEKGLFGFVYLKIARGLPPWR